MADPAAQRLNMVESQLRTNKVTDPDVLRAMGELPRERFLPPAARPVAYVDEDLAVGGGRFLMEPMVMARLVQALAIAPGDAALEVGAGCGYGTALLARLAGRVVALECDPELAARARVALADAGPGEVELVEGPLEAGCHDRGPYDAILVSGAVGALPAALLDQLAEGGRLAAVVAESGEPGRAVLAVRRGGAVSRRVLFDAATPPLPGFAPAPGFVF
jgi:protein-L-isoaspartate(D-aspartate) O-methyltransferase